LQAAPAVLPDATLQGRLQQLTEERNVTARLLELLANDFQVHRQWGAGTGSPPAPAAALLS
jgi:hypothetical protein